MNDDIITALAREYAEEIRKDILPFFPRPLPDSMEVLVKADEEYYARFLEWLLRRFYLVEKSKVAIKYKNAKRLEEDATAFGFEKHCSNAILIQNLIESLFPEIAKEVEG